MSAGDDRLARATAAIDEANSHDPERLVLDGVEQPKEVAHAELMTRWVRTLDPAATDLQLLAARAHHLRRWTVPRTDYPDGRAGYLRWRSHLRKQHADEVAEILTQVGYSDEEIERVRHIVLKQGLNATPPDPQVQTHEDALCIVFLATQLDDVAASLGATRTVEVLVKTLRKMSPAGKRAAVGLDLSPAGRELVEEALAAP